MDSKDSAAISPAPVGTPSPTMPADAASSQGSALTLFPEVIEEKFGDDGSVDAVSVEEGFETASEPESEEDDVSLFGDNSSDSEDVISPPGDVAATALAPGGVEEEEVPNEVEVLSGVAEGHDSSVTDKGETLGVDGDEGLTGDTRQNPKVDENSKLEALDSAPMDSGVQIETAIASVEVVGEVDDKLLAVETEKMGSADTGGSDGNAIGKKDSEATGADSNDVPNVFEAAEIPDSCQIVDNLEIEASAAIKTEDGEAGEQVELGAPQSRVGAEGYGNDAVIQVVHKDGEPQVTETEIAASLDLNPSTDVPGTEASAAKAEGGGTAEKLQSEVPRNYIITEGYANGEVLEVGSNNGEPQVYENGNAVVAEQTNSVKGEDGGSAEDVESDLAEGQTCTEFSANDEHLDVASKDVEPEVAEASAEAFANVAGDAGVQESLERGLEAEAYQIPLEKFDDVNGTVVIAKSLEDVVNGKMELEPQKVNAKSEVTVSEANKDVYSPVVAAEEIASREIDIQAHEISGIKENGIMEPTSVAESKSKESGAQVVVTDDEFMASDVAAEEEDEDEEDDDEVLASDSPTRVAILESSEADKQMTEDMEEDYDEVDTDEEDDGKELFDSAALTALLKAATGSSPDGSSTLTSQDVGRIFNVDRPAGLGSSVPSLRPASARTSLPALFAPSELAVVGQEENMNEEERKLHEQVEQIRVKFLRLVQRLNHSPEDTVAAQVLYRLGLAEGIKRGRQNSRMFNLENAKKKALQLEADGKNDLGFSCNILVIGKTGVGKSATINSIFGEEKTRINAYEPATATVKVISGVVDGVKIQVIDTPGLRTSAMEQSANRKILSSIKKFTKRCPPDIVLYVDRLDSQTRDLNDLPLLRSITGTLASSIWFNAIVALTHAASAPPDGPNGAPMSYEMFTAQRSHVVQHSIRQAAGDMRLMNPVALVENHPSCRRNREGERVLPNGQSWRSQMLLLCYSSKILSEANSLLKLQDSSPGKLFGFRLRSPPIPFLLSSLLQSRAHPKLSPDQGGDIGDSDMELDDMSDTDDDGEEDEYDQLPPFKPLRKTQIAKLTKEQRRAYFEEYDYRVKLLQKKQWKEEIKRMKDIKKRGKVSQNDLKYGDMAEGYDQDAAPASVPVPLPDMALPPSFDCENPVHRYRFLEPTSQLMTRPVLDTHGWDHDCGYDGVSIEQALALAGRFPATAAVQITKDKKDFSIHLDSSIAAKHGDNGSTLAAFEVQPIGRQIGYTLRGETKFKSFKKNKTTGGISVTFLGETVATGMKLEDQLSIGKRVALVASTGAVRAQGDMAYGANLEARLRDKDFPVGQALATLGLSMMKWHGDLALGANLQSQFPVGRSSKVAVRVGLNNKLSGQITVKSSTSEQLQIALLGIVPIALSIIRNIWSSEA